MALPDAWAAYARLVVTIEGPRASMEIRPDALGSVGSWPDELRAPIHILTAWDPGASRPGLGVNRRRQHELEAELPSLVSGLWPARGHDPVEAAGDEGVAVAGLDVEQALGFARRYGQDAIFEWTPTRWSIVSCGTEPRLDAGWTLRANGDPTI